MHAQMGRFSAFPSLFMIGVRINNNENHWSFIGELDTFEDETIESVLRE